MSLYRVRHDHPSHRDELCPECLPFFGADVMRRWVPAVDIFEKDEKLNFKMDLPEVDQKDLSLDIDDNVLTIKGKRERAAEDEDRKFHRSERFYGEFSRSFALPRWSDTTAIDAVFKNGTLFVSIPKKEEDKQKKFQVKIK